MLNNAPMKWNGMPRRGLEVDGKRITYVVPKGPVLERKINHPAVSPLARPIRTQMAKVFLSDGTSRMAEVTL